jgi:TyrR family helix-turn-helix protein/PAS domain S-box-containing protein
VPIAKSIALLIITLYNEKANQRGKFIAKPVGFRNQGGSMTKISSDTLLSKFSAEELIAVLDSINDAVFIDDEFGNAMWINKACEDLYKVKREDIIGKSVEFLEAEGIFFPSVAKLVLDKRKEVDIIHKNKEGKRILSTGIPIFDKKGKLKKIISTSRDITELMNLKNKLEAMQTDLAELKSRDKSFYGDIIADSPSMYNVIQLIERLADLDSTILISGESGSGKGIVAKLLHESGKRSKAPFVKINCGAIPDNLLESELFGYESGSFTGSRKEGKVGLFEVAQNGTLFLDEISELPLNLQVKILQVIQDKEIQRVGGVVNIPVDVRIISATNKDLKKQVHEGKFREDLFYRLNVVPIQVPPLRERPEDIIPLIKHFLQKNNEKFKENKIIDASAMVILLKYNWPGNVRELENILERLVITTKSNTILPINLPSYIFESTRSPGEIDIPHVTNLTKALNEAEKQILVSASMRYPTTRQIARALGVSQPTIVRKLKKYKIRLLDT